MDDDLGTATLIGWLDSRPRRDPCPVVTLTDAQSLDGSLAAEAGRLLALSGPSASRMTHALRAWHDSLLIGIGTVLADDPSLTVRGVEGSNPRPVILDSHLRIPLEARLLSLGTQPIVFCSADAPQDKADTLSQTGASVIRVKEPDERQAGWLSLHSILEALSSMGLRRLMVEGGASVLRAFLRQRLGDALIVTLAPRLVGGMPLLPPGWRAESGDLPVLLDSHWQIFGEDAVLWADLEKSKS
jgi:GTP cyclohydrolase II